MITLDRLAENSTSACEDAVVLPFDLRQKSRLRVALNSGREAAIFTERGSILRGGDVLCDVEGLRVQVIAADETVSTVRGDSALALMRAAYHLGNRHVPLQVAADFLRYQHDHVLDDMVRSLGLQVGTEQAPFEPEPGAYSGAGHAHSHSHGHSHSEGHSHSHAHSHSHLHGHSHGSDD